MRIIGIIIPLLLICISGYLIWKSTDAFEVAADFLGRKMSIGVKGATINAVASSMPEFLTTMFFLFYIKEKGEFVDSFSGGLGVVAGSAIFNILIIPLAVILFGSTKHGSSAFSVDRKVILRDGLFLIIANVLFIMVISRRSFTAIHGLILIIIYILYLLLLRKGFGRGIKAPEVENNFQFRQVKLNVGHFLKIDLKEILLNGKKLNTRYAWITLLISTILMSFGTWFLVKGTELLGAKTYSLGARQFYGLNIPIVFISVLLASAATSIPDTMISIRDARKGNYDDSISNAIGSNIFDLSFALGLPLLLYTLIHGRIAMSIDTQVLSVSYWLIMWLINLTVIPIFIFAKRFTKKTGILLLTIYLVFIFVIVADTSGVEIFSLISTKIMNLTAF